MFVKKEEMIRHFKWHKKRDDSLQHGFMRYSPTDDCGDRYPDCSHNRKQTHYHCLKVRPSPQPQLSLHLPPAPTDRWSLRRCQVDPALPTETQIHCEKQFN